MKKMLFILIVMIMFNSCGTVRMTNKLEIKDTKSGETYVCENKTEYINNANSFFKCNIRIGKLVYSCHINLRKIKKKFDIEEECFVSVD